MRRDRNRDIVLGRLAFAHQSLGDAFAQAPKALRLGNVLRDRPRRARGLLRTRSISAASSRSRSPGCVVIRVRQLDQHRGWRYGSKRHASICRYG